MFAIRTIQLLLFFEILFLALAKYRFSYEPCLPKDEFTCRASKSSILSTYPCVRLDYLCDGDNDCLNGKDEICDGRLHKPTGICQRSDGNHCEDVSKGTAICSPGCAECTGRDQCAACAVNFSGKYCNETCPSGTFGHSCEFDCDYLLNERSKFFSACYSDQSVCDSKSIDRNCIATCECKRTDACRPGWIGNNCQVPCPGFTFGRFCSKKCTCIPENSVGCNKESGICECKQQFYGERCENNCDHVKSDFSKSNLICLHQKVHTLSNDKTALEKKLNDQKTDVGQKLEDHKSSFEQKLSGHRTALDEHKAEAWQNYTGLKDAVDQKVRDHKTTFERNLNDQNATIERKLSAHKVALDDHKAEVSQNFTGLKEATNQQFRDHKSSLEEKINEINIGMNNLKQNLDEQKSEFEKNLTELRTAFNDLKTEVFQSLSDYKTSLEQSLAIHRLYFEQTYASQRSSLEQNLAGHKSSLEQKLADHRTEFDDHKVEVLQRFEKLTNDKAALEKYLTWFLSAFCVAFLLLFVAISWVISMRNSEKQRSDSISEAKVTFSSDRSNLFQSVLDKLRLFTQNVSSTCIDQPTYEMGLLKETDQINANIYATIDELKEQDAKEKIPMLEN